MAITNPTQASSRQKEAEEVGYILHMVEISSRSKRC